MDVPGQENCAMIRRGNVSMVHQIFSPTGEEASVDLGVVPQPVWYQRCRALADQYAAFGEVREAVFWLNVGVESLLQTRMRKYIASTGTELDLDMLDGGNAYWREAQLVVDEQCPDLAKDIVWPSSIKKPSLFQQLKHFCAEVPGAPSAKPIQKHYSIVSKHRNALFHGGSDSRISIDDLEQSIASFDWLANNFMHKNS
tara:strand:- start:1618 stop:2214 length:597 start_codon:yes stop_codon:yes gene_type:complete